LTATRRSGNLRAMTIIFRALAMSAILSLQASAAAPLPPSAPGAQGMDAARLARVGAFMQAITERGDYLGGVTLVARNGRIVA
jgi:CubicO group peptidase (beta-lactamase class C family)